VTSSITNLQAMGCSANLTDDLSSATIIYGTYTRNIIIDSTSTPKITYIDGTGTLIVGAINS